MVETNGMDMVATPAPQAPLQLSDEQSTNDDGVDSTNSCFRFCKRFGSLYYRIIAAWPRTSALTFGVVVPLFLLIAVSVFFGFFLAQLEGPGEIEYNNDVISTRIALAIQDQLIGNITMNLPHICACTYLTDKMYLDRFDEQTQEYEQCLETQRLQKMPSSYPSFQPTMQPSLFNTTNNLTASVGIETPIIESNDGNEVSMSATNEPIVCVEPKSRQKSAIEFAIQNVFTSQFKPCLSADTLMNFTSNPFSDSAICTETGMATTFADIGVTTEDLLMEMKTCGNDALSIAADYKLTNVITRGLADSSPSWNWNRCTLREKKRTKDDVAMSLNQLFNPWVNVSYLKPSALEEEAVNAWMESQQDLYCTYVEDGIAEGKDLSDARYDALEKSFADASGFEDEVCFPNYWAGAWFWFTIMTTVGYGNTAPGTDGGRIMIFTLGFASILIFGVVLAKAGSIVVAIVEDFLLRTHMSFLTRNWIQMVVWGGLYYLWCFAIALLYVYWNETRLGETVTLNDSYWFAYITTTTVGLGDYYLEHAAIVGIDLLIWPLMILYGFVLLAAFLTALGNLVLATDDGTDFADTLAAEQSLFSCCSNWLQRDAEFEASLPVQSSLRKVKPPRQNESKLALNEVTNDATNEADDAIPVVEDNVQLSS